MSQLDEELAQAAASPPVEQGPLAPVAVPQSMPKQPPKSSLALLLALLAGGTVVLLTVFNSLQGAAVYSKGIDDLVAQRAQLVGRNLRIEGTLVSGSLRKRDKPCEFRFELAKNGSTLPVRYTQCVIPDTFRDVPGMEVSVTAEGQLAQAGYFEARQILAKCPSKYEEKARSGVAIPYDRPLPTFESDGSTSKP